MGSFQTPIHHIQVVSQHIGPGREPPIRVYKVLFDTFSESLSQMTEEKLLENLEHLIVQKRNDISDGHDVAETGQLTKIYESIIYI